MGDLSNEQERHILHSVAHRARAQLKEASARIIESAGHFIAVFVFNAVDGRHIVDTVILQVRRRYVIYYCTAVAEVIVHRHIARTLKSGRRVEVVYDDLHIAKCSIA